MFLLVEHLVDPCLENFFGTQEVLTHEKKYGADDFSDPVLQAL